MSETSQQQADESLARPAWFDWALAATPAVAELIREAGA